MNQGGREKPIDPSIAEERPKTAMGEDPERADAAQKEFMADQADKEE